MSNVAPPDSAESGFGLGLDLLSGHYDDIAEAAGKTPMLGSAISGMQSAYHLGSAVYDGVTGDRDGAVAHGTQALYNAACVNPDFAAATEMLDLGLGSVGTGVRFGAEVMGHGDIAGEIPTGLDDIAATGAVGLTNLLFGADQDPGTGTREGEIGAGVGAMNTMAALALGPLGMIPAFADGDKLGRMIGSVTSAGEGTSGSKPGPVAAAAAKLHDDSAPGDNCPVPGAL